jgi:hypothetical protein
MTNSSARSDPYNPNRESEFEVTSAQCPISQVISLEIESSDSDIYLLGHLFGRENALSIKVDDGKTKTFKLDGSEKIWQIERDLDIAERDDFQWEPGGNIKVAVVGIMADPARSPSAEQRRIAQIIEELVSSPCPPSAVVRHGPRWEFIWKLKGRPTRKNIEAFETQALEVLEAMPSDLTLFRIMPGLRDAHLHKPGSEYLSDGVYQLNDLTKMLDDLAVPPPSAPRQPVPEWLQRINSAYVTLENAKEFAGIGHILAHRMEVKVNTAPAYSQVWHRNQGDGKQDLYAVECWGLEDGSFAIRLSGDGPKQLAVVSHPSSDGHFPGHPRLEDGLDLLDAQVNIVRDMHRSMPVETRKWLQGFVTTFAEDDLQRVAATMLGAGMGRDDGIEVLALCHGDLFAEDIEWGEGVPDDFLASSGVIQTEAGMEARLAAAAKAFNAVPDVGIDPTAMPTDIFTAIQPPRITEDMVPTVVWKFAEANAEQIGAAQETIIAPSVFVLSTAIDDQIKIRPRSNAQWVESARVWNAVVAPPSAKKSPGASIAMKPLKQMDRERAAKAVSKMADYDLAMKVYKAKEAAYVKAKAKDDDAEKPVPPEKPRSERLLIEDATTEAVVNIAMHQDRGLGLYRDELSGFFGSFDAYRGGKGGKDEPFWLSAYNGDSYTLDRVSRDGGTANNVGTSIFGGIQPDALRALKLHKKRNGMLARFTPFILDTSDSSVGKNVAVEERATVQFRSLINRLVDFNPSYVLGDEVHEHGPVVCPDVISGEIDAFLEEVNKLKQLEGTVPPGMAEHLGKLEGMTYRLLLIYHCVEVCNPWKEPISQDSCDRVITFMRDYVIPSLDVLYNQVLAQTTDANVQAQAQRVGDWILAKRRPKFRLRDIQKNNRWFPSADLEGNRARYMILNILREANWIEPIGLYRPSDHTQYAPHNEWKVNPLVWRVMADRQRVVEETRKRNFAMLRRNVARR